MEDDLIEPLPSLTKPKKPTAKTFKMSKYLARPLEEHEKKLVTCPVCDDLMFEPVMCNNERCERTFCRKCAMFWRQYQNQCPVKCGGVFTFSPIHPPQLPFKCPYNDSCSIQTSEDLMTHLDNCRYLPKQLVEQKRLKRNNMCPSGHNLLILMDIHFRYNKKCALCQEKSRCRLYCSVCKQHYCISCRPIICSQTQPPVDTDYIIHNSYIQLRTSVCDVCGQKPQHGDYSIRKDATSQIVICDYCYHFLPHQLPFKPPYSSHNECMSHHPLLTTGKTIKAKCACCKLDKVCKRKCVQCKQYYCLQCKKVPIFSNVCQQNHCFTMVSSIKGKPVICDYCIKPVSVEKNHFVDEICEFTICHICFQIEKYKDMYRSANVGQQVCKQHKNMMYLQDSQMKYYNDCSQCQRKVYMKYACKGCKGHKVRNEANLFQLICYVCLQPHLYIKCPLGHYFWDIPKDTGRVCQKCSKKTLKGVYCKQCELAICQSCYQACKK